MTVALAKRLADAARERHTISYDPHGTQRAIAIIERQAAFMQEAAAALAEPAVPIDEAAARATIRAELAALEIALPLAEDIDEPGVVLDAQGETVCTVDVWRDGDDDRAAFTAEGRAHDDFPAVRS